MNRDEPGLAPPSSSTVVEESIWGVKGAAAAVLPTGCNRRESVGGSKLKERDLTILRSVVSVRCWNDLDW